MGEFIKMYNPPYTKGKAVWAIIKRMSKATEGQIIHLDKEAKAEICKEMNISEDTIRYTIRRLMKEGVIRRIQPEYYQVNPYNFGYGEWEDISKIPSWKVIEVK